MAKYLTRRGDGALIEMTSDEIMSELEAGTEDAADKGKIAPLSKEDLDMLLDIFTDPSRFVSVAPGNEVVVTHDIGTLRVMGDQGNSGVGIPLSRVQGIQVHERAFCADTMELGHIDYSFKPVKPVIAMEQQELENALLVTILPLFYGAMPNLGLYYSPDGPFGNPSDLLPAGKIQEAYEAQEGAVEHAIRDMVYVCERLAEVGCDGINFDTTGAAGDTDFKATLHAVEHLKKSTDMCIEVGMAGEFVLGMHGGLQYEGQTLAGLYCHDQVKLVEKAGADIFGPVVNTKPSKNMPWNVARAVTFVKACVEASNIPIHVNMGMGVGGSPIFETPPTDSVSRASKAMVEIAKVDGLQIGVGDPMGMSIAHGVAAGMGGIRTAGDLVARMQMARKMRINDAKAYVAKKLKVSPADLSDVHVMREVREELDLGIITSVPGCAKGIEAKVRIAELLDIEIAGVNRLKKKMKF